ncbi:hypothetical protein Pcinc_043086 [Petrolisthes cinctipes]|uniref:Uncharacterized protein n=1 Tax=Petrolisthes cinctipes TaxID=88211 RepID=A0AAE1BGH0_PETCI|nr:hypothetical protein Pcinc_043086 [Petrolisthes cinctipes]
MHKSDIDPSEIFQYISGNPNVICQHHVFVKASETLLEECASLLHLEKVSRSLPHLQEVSSFPHLQKALELLRSKIQLYQEVYWDLHHTTTQGPKRGDTQQ